MSVNDVIAALPPESKIRLTRMASRDRRSIEDLAVYILSKGANTCQFPVMASIASSGNIFLSSGANTHDLTLAGRVAAPVSDVSDGGVTMGKDYEPVEGRRFAV